MNKLYALFGGEYYYAQGGVADLHCFGDNIDDLVVLAHHKGFDWFQVVDVSERDAGFMLVVARSKYLAHNCELKTSNAIVYKYTNDGWEIEND